MTETPWRLRRANWQADRVALRQVREQVFIVEQQVPVEEEWDDIDPICQHVLVLDQNGLPIGTGRLTPEGKIGRMAVMAEWRKHGLGAAILRELMDWASEIGWQKLALHAQTQAQGFYQKFGFTPQGDVFMEAGIEHITMVGAPRRREQSQPNPS